MARAIVYSSAMVAFIAATAMTFAAIHIPLWITWTVPSATGPLITKSIGLHQSCLSTTASCHPFPQDEDCYGTDRYFCSMWRSLGFLMWIAAIVELATLVGFVIILLGGRQQRQRGWNILPAFLMLVVLLQCASMSIVAYLFDHDNRFFVGWKLDTSWILCTTSWSVSLACAGFIWLSKYIMEPEGDYELIPNVQDR